MSVRFTKSAVGLGGAIAISLEDTVWAIIFILNRFVLLLFILHEIMSFIFHRHSRLFIPLETNRT